MVGCPGPYQPVGWIREETLDLGRDLLVQGVWMDSAGPTSGLYFDGIKNEPMAQDWMFGWILMVRFWCL